MKNSKENEELLAMLLAEVRELKALISESGQVKNQKLERLHQADCKALAALMSTSSSQAVSMWTEWRGNI